MNSKSLKLAQQRFRANSITVNLKENKNIKNLPYTPYLSIPLPLFKNVKYIFDFFFTVLSIQTLYIFTFQRFPEEKKSFVEVIEKDLW